MNRQIAFLSLFFILFASLLWAQKTETRDGVVLSPRQEMELKEELRYEMLKTLFEQEEKITKSGWKVDDPYRPLLFVLFRHTERQKENPHLIEIVGNATGNLPLADLRKRAKQDLLENTGDAGYIPPKHGQLGAGFPNVFEMVLEETIREDIPNVFEESYALYRRSLQGAYEYKLVYLLDVQALKNIYARHLFDIVCREGNVLYGAQQIMGIVNGKRSALLIRWNGDTVQWTK